MRFETDTTETQSLKRTNLRTEEPIDKLEVKIVKNVCKDIMRSAKSNKD